MATNSFSALMAEVNQVIAEANEATSNANGAAIQAQEAMQKANVAAENADEAAAAANGIAADVDAEINKWEGATVSAVTLEPGEAATMTMTEKNGVKNFEFGIPAGRDGAEGEKGDTGESGVTFTLSGTTLHIKTVV